MSAPSICSKCFHNVITGIGGRCIAYIYRTHRTHRTHRLHKLSIARGPPIRASVHTNLMINIFTKSGKWHHTHNTTTINISLAYILRSAVSTCMPHDTHSSGRSAFHCSSGTKKSVPHKMRLCGVRASANGEQRRGVVRMSPRRTISNYQSRLA